MVSLKNSRVFVSHSSKDKDIATKVILHLESQGNKCWIAPRDIPPGEDWAESILDGIDGAAAMILVVTPAMNDSPHIRREVERAVSNKIPIIPLIVEQTKFAKWVQYYISAHQWVDATEKSLFEKAMLDISDKISKVVLLHKEDELEVLNGDKPDACESDSCVQEDIDLLVSDGRRKQNGMWILLSLIILIGISFLVKTCGNPDGDSAQGQIYFNIPENHSNSIAYGLRIIQMSSGNLAFNYFCGDYSYIAIVDSNLCQLSNTIISEDSIQRIAIAPISGESMKGLACGVVNRRNSSNTSQESIGIYEFGVEGELSCISTLDYKIFGDSIAKVMVWGFEQSGTDIFSIASLVEKQNQNLQSAFITRVTRQGEFLSNRTLVNYTNQRASDRNRLRCISVENGILAVTVTDSIWESVHNTTVFWIDSTDTVRNVQSIETEGTGFFSGIVKSNIYGAILTYTSLGGINNGSKYFIWLDDTGNFVQKRMFDTPQATRSFSLAADLQSGDYICGVESRGAIIQGNLESGVSRFRPFILDSIYQKYHSLYGADIFGSYIEFGSGVVGIESRYVALITAKNGPYLAEMQENGEIISFEHLNTSVFYEDWHQSPLSVDSLWSIRFMRPTQSPFYHSPGYQDSLSIDLNGNFLVSKENFLVHSSTKLECYFWITDTVNSDSLALGLLPGTWHETFPDSIAPFSQASPLIVWGNCGTDSASVTASYFNGEEIVECHSELSSNWLSVEKWNKIEICFTDSTAIFLLNDSVFAESDTDLKLMSRYNHIMLYGTSRSSIHGIDDIRLLLHTDWFW